MIVTFLQAPPPRFGFSSADSRFGESRPSFGLTAAHRLVCHQFVFDRIRSHGQLRRMLNILRRALCQAELLCIDDGIIFVGVANDLASDNDEFTIVDFC